MNSFLSKVRSRPSLQVDRHVGRFNEQALQLGVVPQVQGFYGLLLQERVGFALNQAVNDMVDDEALLLHLALLRRYFV
ncbi:hypothetical protein D3C77_423250 [compost metagenome]